jgi:uncharacterized membrane protein YdfJ with MMPL/SSD domain
MVKLRPVLEFFGLDTFKGWLVFVPAVTALIGSLGWNWHQHQESQDVEINCGNCIPVVGGELCLRTSTRESSADNGTTQTDP